MKYLGSHYERKTFYFDLKKDSLESLPKENWICFIIANDPIDNMKKQKLTEFLKYSIDRDLLECKGQGKLGGFLHLSADEAIVDLEINNNYPEIELTTTGDNETDLDDGFWDCFGATALPERADYETLKVVCLTLDNSNYSDKLKALIEKFNNGYLPD